MAICTIPINAFKIALIKCTQVLISVLIVYRHAVIALVRLIVLLAVWLELIYLAPAVSVLVLQALTLLVSLSNANPVQVHVKIAMFLELIVRVVSLLISFISIIAIKLAHRRHIRTEYIVLIA
jgi:hypothetical protein